MAAKDRRSARRFPVTFRLVCSDGRAFRPGTVLDLSTSGVRFRTSFAVEPGEVLELLPIGEAGNVLFSASGRVVRCEPAPDRPDRWHVALEFVDLDEEGRQALRTLTGTMPPVRPGRLDPDPAPANGPPSPAETLPHMRIRSRITAGVERLTGS